MWNKFSLFEKIWLFWTTIFWFILAPIRVYNYGMDDNFIITATAIYFLCYVAIAFSAYLIVYKIKQ